METRELGGAVIRVEWREREREEKRKIERDVAKEQKKGKETEREGNHT